MSKAITSCRFAASLGKTMRQPLNEVDDFELVILTAEGLSLEEMAVRLGGTNREISAEACTTQRVRSGGPESTSL